jgi:hypothetical protein
MGSRPAIRALKDKQITRYLDARAMSSFSLSWFMHVAEVGN